MWGNILTEVSYIQNFNMSFSNNKADVLIHLTQWQYWWWFWFSFLWTLYYLLIARVVRYRTLKFNPRIASTFRPHGKWGDLLTCIIPVTWCINILLNSNFILKLIEWQSESSLFTLRVRAKQWYWIYKLDLRNVADIFSAPRNLGRNKWQFSTFGDLQTAEDYLHIMQMRAYNNWSKDFWTELGKKSIKKNKFSVVSSVDCYKDELSLLSVLKKKKHMLGSNNLTPTLEVNKPYTNYNLDFFFSNNTLLNKDGTEKNVFFKDCLDLTDIFFNNNLFKKNLKIRDQKLKINTNLFSLKKDFNFFRDKNIFTFLHGMDYTNTNTLHHPDLDDENRTVRKNLGRLTPIRLLKKPLVDTFFSKNLDKDDKFELISLRFNTAEASITQKPVKPTVYLTFKQKRYNQRNIIGKKNVLFLDNDNKKHSYSGNPFLKDNSIIAENFGNPTRQYRLLKKAKNRLDTTRVANWNRLLRSRRVLVLPAHVNITVITNSFDIIHSWHIPGLGLKMDCLPGRATHHTLYIDNVGLYYGQCAEICGRYHHHMPIRICALPFEHFLVWWHTFGLPKFLFPANKNLNGVDLSSKYFTRKFSW